MTWAQLVAAAEGLRAATADRIRAAGVAPGLRLAGLGWATVDIDRAQGELDGLLAGDRDAPRLGPWVPLERDLALGARARLRASAEPVGAPAPTAPAAPIRTPALVLLEPDTEGRLAASLARFGEGVAVIYLGEGMPAPGRLLPGGPAWGPHVVILAAKPRPEP